MKVTDSYEKVFKDKNRVLVVLGHPDDIEVNCGGIIARLVEDNKKVRIVVTTNGGKGVKDKKGLKENEFAKSRIAEQIRAGLELGVPKSENFNLDIPDGELETTVENIGKVAFHIRQFKPDAIITHNPHDKVIEFFKTSAWVNHRDHRHTALLVIDAVYPYARDRGFFPEHFIKGVKPHSVTHLLFADYYNHPKVRFFDISKQLEKKKKALIQHESAFDEEFADDIIEENKIDKSYYEPLGYYEVY